MILPFKYYIQDIHIIFIFKTFSTTKFLYRETIIFKNTIWLNFSLLIKLNDSSIVEVIESISMQSIKNVYYGEIRRRYVC